jgi:hypothetical protein
MEAQHSTFLYRDSSLQKHVSPEAAEDWRYDTQSLRFYREKAGQKELAIADGGKDPKQLSIFAAGPFRQSARDFLQDYAALIKGLRSFAPLENRESSSEAEILTTLLPMAASIRRTSPNLNTAELFKAVQCCSLQELKPFIRS